MNEHEKNETETELCVNLSTKQIFFFIIHQLSLIALIVVATPRNANCVYTSLKTPSTSVRNVLENYHNTINSLT